MKLMAVGRGSPEIFVFNLKSPASELLDACDSDLIFFVELGRRLAVK